MHTNLNTHVFEPQKKTGTFSALIWATRPTISTTNNFIMINCVDGASERVKMNF